MYNNNKSLHRMINVNWNDQIFPIIPNTANEMKLTVNQSRSPAATENVFLTQSEGI